MTGAAMLGLALVKESGAFLALLAMAVMALDLWREGRGAGARRFAALAAPAMCLAAGVASWKIYLALNGIGSEKPFRYWEIGENIALFLAGESPWHQQYLLSNFFRYLTMPQMMGEGHFAALLPGMGDDPVPGRVLSGAAQAGRGRTLPQGEALRAGRGRHDRGHGGVRRVPGASLPLRLQRNGGRVAAFV